MPIGVWRIIVRILCQSFLFQTLGMVVIVIYHTTVVDAFGFQHFEIEPTCSMYNPNGSKPLSVPNDNRQYKSITFSFQITYDELHWRFLVKILFTWTWTSYTLQYVLTNQFPSWWDQFQIYARTKMNFCWVLFIYFEQTNIDISFSFESSYCKKKTLKIQ